MKNKAAQRFVLCMLLVLTLCLPAPVSAGQKRCPPSKIIKSKAPLEEVQAQLNKLSPITIAPDCSYLPTTEQAVIADLIKAAKSVDRIFLQQVSAKNHRLLKALECYKGTAQQPYYDYFKIMYGPWDRLNANAPFINLDEPKPAGANYYPADLSTEEFEAWLDTHPEQEESFISPFTVIKRRGQNLKAVPYNREYRDLLVQPAFYLRKAAAKTSDPTLAAYLKSRTKAFFTNDYRQSDIDWIGLNGDIELVIGPYETYEDELLGYKAAFETFVCLVDRNESDKLKTIETYRQAMIDNYPLPEGVELTPKGLSSPIKVVNEVFSAGDARVGIPAIAFNLPNDEWVRENVGSKNVMIKNMLEAKYNGVLVPIKDRILSETDKDKPTFDGFFNYVLMHEISHGLGPGTIVVNGQETTVREQLRELYSTIEECQADTLSMVNCQYLIDTPGSPMPQDLEESLYSSYLAGMFRSIRFGTGTAHGGAITIELNWHLENGGFNVDADGRFYLDTEKLKASIRSLAERLLMIELNGDYAGAQALINQYRLIAPVVQAALDMIQDVPTDVIKKYPFDAR